MEITLSFIAGLLSVVLSVYVTYLSYKIYTFNRLNKAWLAVMWAFILIIFRRSIGFITDFGYFPEVKTALKSIEGFLLLVISVLYIWGFWSMLKQFETFDVVEKRVQEKVKKVLRKRL